MSIFSLLIYSCVITSQLNGYYSKTCNFSDTGELFRLEEDCINSGKSRIGNIIFSDTIVSNSEIPKIESFKCNSRYVK